MCRHSVAPLAWERGSHEIEKLAPGDGKRSHREVKFRAPGGPKWLSGGLWRPPGASWAAGEAQEGALSGNGALLFFLKGPKNIFWSVQGPSWGALGGFWVDFGSFSPPGGGAGEAPGVILGGFVRGAAREVKNKENSRFFCYILGDLFYAILVLCCVTCCVLCCVAKIEKM